MAGFRKIRLVQNHTAVLIFGVLNLNILVSHQNPRCFYFFPGFAISSRTVLYKLSAFKSLSE
jgi:hypothetical protein